MRAARSCAQPGHARTALELEHTRQFSYTQNMAGVDKNPFDLEGRNEGPEQWGPGRRVWTLEEQSDRLSGYLEIPPAYWDQIRYGKHVRYFTKAEGYRPGGFVLKNPFDTKPKGGAEDKRFIKLQNGFFEKARGYAQWIVAYEDIEKIYVKPDAEVLVTLQSLEVAVKGLNDNIRKIAEFTKKIDARLAALERR